MQRGRAGLEAHAEARALADDFRFFERQFLHGGRDQTVAGGAHALQRPGHAVVFALGLDQHLHQFKEVLLVLDLLPAGLAQHLIEQAVAQRQAIVDGALV